MRALPPRSARWSAALLAVLLSICARAQSAEAVVTAWITQSGGPAKLESRAGLQLAGREPLRRHIAIDPATRYQDVVGFGAAMTDASAYLLQHRMSVGQRDALMQELFAPSGLGLSFLRLTIGASDFSRTHYSFDDVPAGESDPELAKFSIAPNLDAVLPLTRQALALNPALKIMASPWSPPAWMKSSEDLIRGRLLPQYRAAFAEYLSRYVQAYAVAGIPMFAITLQNEPHFEPKDYPGMRLDVDDRRALLGEHVGPLFAERHPGVRILEWDHNWNRPEEPLGVLADDRARGYVAGVAWHCYEGHVSAQSKVHQAHPDKETYLTECSGGGWERKHDDALTDLVRVVLIGGTRNWARGVLLWNLALDERAGPHLGGCTNCRGVVTVDDSTGEFRRNPEYYALAHFSRFVPPGARRIESSDGDEELDNVAFDTGDGGRIVLVVVNSSLNPRRFSAGVGRCTFEDTLPPRSVATYAWDPAAGCG